MNSLVAFADVLDAVEQLDPEAQAELVAVINRRLAERGRERIAASVEQAAARIGGGAMPTNDSRRNHERGTFVRRVLLRSPAFGRDLKKWLKSHPETADTIAETLEQLSADATHPQLRTHKLRGQLAGCWACSAGNDVRIVFEYTQHHGAEAILLQSIGSHDQVY